MKNTHCMQKNKECKAKQVQNHDFIDYSFHATLAATNLLALRTQCTQL